MFAPSVAFRFCDCKRSCRRITHPNPLCIYRQVHYLTLQSNIGKGTDLEWQITNINDVIKPTFNYYFSRFGH